MLFLAPAVENGISATLSAFSVILQTSAKSMILNEIITEMWIIQQFTWTIEKDGITKHGKLWIICEQKNSHKILVCFLFQAVLQNGIFRLFTVGSLSLLESEHVIYPSVGPNTTSKMFQKYF